MPVCSLFQHHFAFQVKPSATFLELIGQCNAHIHTSRCWGSIAVTIPQSLAKSTGMHPGDKVSFELDAGRLIISPVSRRKYKLHELLAMQGDEPLLIDKAWNAMPTSGQEVAV